MRWSSAHGRRTARRLTGAVAALCLAGTGLVGTAARVQADEVDPTTAQELVDAVEAANTNGVDDTIDLGGHLFELGEELVVEPDDGHALRLQGPGTIDGGGTTTVLRLSEGSEVTLDQITVQNGLSPGLGGGGISNSGDLTITASTISDNTASGSIVSVGGGGIRNLGDLTIAGSTISGNTTAPGFVNLGGGGGILNSGNLAITSSTISGNLSRSASGGGIDNSGTLEITSSTVSANLAPPHDGGGIHNADDGTVTITSSTISGNTSGNGTPLPRVGGGIANLGTATITSSTITGNVSDDGGAVHDVGSATIKASIVHGNADGNGDPDDCAGDGTSSEGYNVVGVGCPTAGTADTTDDPDLGPLAANGGATTTHAIGGESTAFGRHDGSDGDCVGTDQRGVPRPQGPHCDAGAFELDHHPLTVAAEGSGEGTVVSDPAGIDCPAAACASTFLDGTEVTLAATAAPGSVFVGWSEEGCPTTDPCTLTMTEPTEIEATFRHVPRQSCVLVVRITLFGIPIRICI